MSNMYSLLNYIAATSKETFGTSILELDDATDDEYPSNRLESGLRGMSEDERRLVGISTISVVTKLALEFRMEEVTRLTISMLLQRLHSAEPSVEAAIAYNLVDLALSAPENAFVDIIHAFSSINRQANPDDPRFSNNMVRQSSPKYMHTQTTSDRSWLRKQGWQQSSINDLNFMRFIFRSF
jgi:phosphatidylinositol 4-kinase A